MLRFLTAELVSGALAVALLTGCSGNGGATYDETVTNADWLYHGNDTKEQRFSPLAQINTNNIGRLGLAYALDLPDENALEATPLAVNGKLYFSGGFGRVYAVDAVSGKIDWTYDARDVETDPRAAARIYGVNRGVAYWDGKIMYASRDGRMIALDAASGKPLWTTRFLEPKDNSASTGAPRIFGDKIIIGSSGAEEGGRGFVTAFDGKTGQILWRFYIVPGNPAVDKDDTTRAVANTWSGEWWKFGAGGNAWNGITYDPEFKQVLIGTGNGGPWNCHERARGGKDNLFLASVVALDENTGKYKWHYQYNPGECWDWKATSDIILADIKIKDQPRKVLLQAPSNGFFYVIDRASGKLLSAEKYAKVNWADRIDLKTGRPVEKPGIRYEKTGVTLFPGPYGAHSWQASAYNPKTGLVYIPTMQTGLYYEETPAALARLHSDIGKPRLRQGVDLRGPRKDLDDRDFKGSLVAWDPVRQKKVWSVPYNILFNGGVMTTAGGLVFQGTENGYFYAYDAAVGKKLWQFYAGLGIMAPPITYAVNGRQYVSILVGIGGGPAEGGIPGRSMGWKFGLQPRRLLTFVLDGKAKLPDTPKPDFSTNVVDDASIKLDPVRVARGHDLYELACTFCHGGAVISAGGAPDLRESSIAVDRNAFRQVVKEGALMPRGMPKIDVTDEQLEDLYQFIRAEARKNVQRYSPLKTK